MNTKNALAAALITVTVAAALAGCVSSPSPAATSPTPTPPPTTPAPTQWPPSTIGGITSSQVRIQDPQDNIRVSVNRNGNTMQQTEDISVLLTNTGLSWANNTFITIRETDAQTAEFYYSGQFNVGNMPPLSSQWVNITTTSHDIGFSVLLQLQWFWGDNLEFQNTYQRSITIAPVDTAEL
jgi:hypothetical protein